MKFPVKSKWLMDISVLSLLLLLPSFVHADTETGGVKTWVGANFVRVYNSVPPASGTGTARCTGGYIGGMDLVITTDFGKAMFTKLLAAEAAGQSVIFGYTYNASSSMCTLDSVAPPS